MSEENLFEIDSVDQEASVADGMAGETEIVDFDQNGLLLKIATDGIAIQDYVKRLKESDILVAVDGELYLDGTAKLNDKFMMEAGDEAKWLLTFWRDGQLFDILLRAPIQSQFGLATEQETGWAMEERGANLTRGLSVRQEAEAWASVTTGLGEEIAHARSPCPVLRRS